MPRAAGVQDKQVPVRAAKRAPGDAARALLAGAALGALLGGLGLATFSLSGTAPDTRVPPRVAEPPEPRAAVSLTGWTAGGPLTPDAELPVNSAGR